jgi:SNF2 family DNA or RNA helicase
MLAASGMVPRSPVVVRAFDALPKRHITEQGITIDFDETDRRLLEDTGTCITPGVRTAGLEAFRMSLRAAELAALPGFDRLIGLPMVRDMEVLEHQVRTAQTVLQRMAGRAMLCDEVGLGKTVEAGLILSELMLRGLVKSVLVLVPPSLIEQWQAEMRRKFGIELISHDNPDFKKHQGDPGSGWHTHDRVIASYHTAKRAPHSDAIAARHWDMVIFDEAHHLRNRTTLLWRFASKLNKRYALLLTATPVQNQLDELFNLVTVLEPGLLSTASRFTDRFVDRQDKLAPRNVEQLQALLSEVMVRNRRSTVGLQLTRRWAKTLRVELTDAERSLYERTSMLVRQHLGRHEGTSGGLPRVALITLQMELGSSSDAAAGTLAKLAEQRKLDDDTRLKLSELAEEAATFAQTSGGSKADRLLALLADPQREFDKLVVFTQFRHTQAMLLRRLEAAGHEVAVFHGGLSRLDKERQVQRFRDRATVLLTTDAGSEGRNLQFCNAICNYDLPWNPMRIEQRIGRLSRIGQSRDVHVFNLVAAGTIEDAILHLLDAKLAMFELVVGEIDMVLGNLDDERDFGDMVADLWRESNDQDDFARRMDDLGERLAAAKRAYLEQRAIDDRLFGDKFRPQA